MNYPGNQMDIPSKICFRLKKQKGLTGEVKSDATCRRSGSGFWLHYDEYHTGHVGNRRSIWVESGYLRVPQQGMAQNGCHEPR